LLSKSRARWLRRSRTSGGGPEPPAVLFETARPSFRPGRGTVFFEPQLARGHGSLPESQGQERRKGSGPLKPPTPAPIERPRNRPPARQRIRHRAFVLVMWTLLVRLFVDRKRLDGFYGERKKQNPHDYLQRREFRSGPTCNLQGTRYQVFSDVVGVSYLASGMRREITCRFS